MTGAVASAKKYPEIKTISGYIISASAAHYQYIAHVQIPQIFSDISMSRPQPDLDQLHCLIILVVTEGFHNVLAVIHHIKLPRRSGQQEPLKCHRDHGYAEYDIVYVISAVPRIVYGDDGEYR